MELLLFNAQVGCRGRYKYIGARPGRPPLPLHSFPYTMNDLFNLSREFHL